MSKNTKPTLPSEIIEQKIYLIRGYKVMIDSDLADLYEVETFNLNKAVKRNFDRFPNDFMFQLTKAETDFLRSQFATSKTNHSLRFQTGISRSKRGGRRYLPYVFTQEGIAMLSSVLRSGRAVQVNIAIMRTFVKIRTLLGSHIELVKRLDALEQKYDGQFKLVFQTIRELMKPEPVPLKQRIGFNTENKK